MIEREKMVELVERLRGFGSHSRYTPDPYKLAWEAAAEITRLSALAGEREAAILDLIEAVEADFCDEITDLEAPDEDAVHAYGGKFSAITFGKIRRAREALASGPAVGEEGV